MKVILFSRCMQTEWKTVDIIYGSVGSECILVRFQTVRHVVFDVIENQFLKAPNQEGVLSFSLDTADLQG